MLKAVVALLALVVCAGAALMFLSSRSTLAFDPAPKAIGESTPIAVRVANPHGARRVEAEIEQNGSLVKLAEISQPATRFTFFRHHDAPQIVHFALGKAAVKEGKARLIVEATSNDMRASTDSIASNVDVVFHPPSVSTDGFQHYINQGGSEMALLTPSGAWTEAGVQVGNLSFPSFPFRGSERIALFAYSWDSPPTVTPFVYAKNAAGDQARSEFWFKIFPKKFRARDLVIDDRFLEKVVNQIDPNGSGDLLTRFLKINGEMRRENNKTLADLRLKTAVKFLWTQPFLQLANAKVESAFADVRTYVYQGKKIDQQVHLGFDLAVSAHTPVLASNNGTVVWAAPLGIYGNCIVLDHGLSLQSIYAHLSEFAVKEGDTVKRGQLIGKSGSTGLAGGDHLHFSMQIGGVQVNPIEWWDEHWIRDHILGRLGPE
ncbi:MAG TPA: M23 family metallopeptidase [Bryobacteraceae bacterium]|nr:M23 family metallopeptidase [Bryobacteraceae bacterium]